jgi:hypothetical protein
MTEAATEKISPSDIEAKLRDVQGQVDAVKDNSRKKAVVGGVVSGVLLLLIIFFLGQRAGKKKSTILEIRRL